MIAIVVIAIMAVTVAMIPVVFFVMAEEPVAVFLTPLAHGVMPFVHIAMPLFHLDVVFPQTVRPAAAHVFQIASAIAFATPVIAVEIAAVVIAAPAIAPFVVIAATVPAMAAVATVFITMMITAAVVATAATAVAIAEADLRHGIERIEQRCIARCEIVGMRHRTNRETEQQKKRSGQKQRSASEHLAVEREFAA